MDLTTETRAHSDIALSPNYINGICNDNRGFEDSSEIRPAFRPAPVTDTESAEHPRTEEKFTSSAENGMPKRRSEEIHLFKPDSLADFVDPRVAILLSVLGMLLYIMDVGSDVGLVAGYFISGDVNWAATTLVFIVLYQVIVFIVLAHDGGICQAVTAPVLPIILGVKIIKQYWRMEHSQASKDARNMMCKEALRKEADKGCFRMMECVFEAGPQFYFQSYLLFISFSEKPMFAVLQIFSILTSLVTISSTPVLIVRCERLSEGHHQAAILRWAYAALRMLVTIVMVAARTTAIILFTASFGYYIFILIALHILFFILIIYVNTTRMHYNIGEAFVHALYVSISALTSLDVFTIKEDDDTKHMPGTVRAHVWGYHLLQVTSNSFLVTIWYILDGFSFKNSHVVLIGVMSAIAAGFLLDMVSRFIYTSEGGKPQVSPHQGTRKGNECRLSAIRPLPD